MADDYEIGFRKPPQHTRFPPGKSGNPNGRPKGSKNFKTDLAEELGEPVLLREGNREMRVTKQRALVKSIVARAIKGDQRAATLAFKMLSHVMGSDDEGDRDLDLSADDEAIIADFLAKNREEPNR